MDGNGRWSKDNRCRHRWDGHRYGVRSVRAVIEAAIEKNIDTLTLFAFSRENAGRSEKEKTALIELFKEVLSREVPQMIENGVQLRLVGDISGLSENLHTVGEAAVRATSSGKRLRLNIAVNYSGRWHIAQAMKALSKSICSDALASDDDLDLQLHKILEKDFGTDPDLLIRTGGEYRISNFLLWQLAYTELYFDDKLWPDYDRQDFNAALQSYAQRNRRYGLEGHVGII